MGKWSYKRKASNPRWASSNEPKQKPKHAPAADGPEPRPYCSCVRVKADDVGRRIANPKCPLHGDRVERSPF